MARRFCRAHIFSCDVPARQLTLEFGASLHDATPIRIDQRFEQAAGGTAVWSAQIAAQNAFKMPAQDAGRAALAHLPLQVGHQRMLPPLDRTMHDLWVERSDPAGDPAAACLCYSHARGKPPDDCFQVVRTVALGKPADT